MKITFLGAGSTIFVKNVVGDCMLSDKLDGFEVALLDIDEKRLDESYSLICALRDKYKPSVKVTKYLSTQAEDAFKDANYIINAIQVGGYDPCTITDFEIPKKYNLTQTIGDTLGIGGIFRGLRTIKVLETYVRIIEKVAPNAYFLNYTNPMSILTGWLLRHTKIKAVGLCHSCQVIMEVLLMRTGLEKKYKPEDIQYHLAGINHMCWLLDAKEKKTGKDIYPELKEGFHKDEILQGLRDDGRLHKVVMEDFVRREIMDRFGYYNTESSEHSAEYHPYFIKKDHPELIDRFLIPLDEYPRRCVRQIERWEKQRDEILNTNNLVHERSIEYGSRIIEAIETGIPYKIYGNVLNNGIITNLPANACVEVPIMVDDNGFNPCIVGDIPDQLAGLNMTHIPVHNMTIKAAALKKKEYIYMAAYLDPHTRDQLTLDEIKSLCDDLIEAHGDWLPEYN